MKKYLALVLAMMLCLLCGCEKTTMVGITTTKTDKTPVTEPKEEAQPEAPEEKPAEEAVLTGKVQVEIVVKDYGTIALELDADTAPKTVTNFVKLAKDGFYDGLTFHRIMAGFMMQGGDPLGNGTGGSAENIVGEFAANGFENSISHTRGAISMARAQHPNSASSQFFIVHEDSVFLDGQYAAFGYVTEGMEVVDAICADAQPVDNNGTIPADQQPVIESITVLE
ncbi:MAG: peptidylprolyl isomerase [Oscillibacter sp.]|nr:peptidylprolyl isomerase [Oscillibacter sp.]